MCDSIWIRVIRSNLSNIYIPNYDFYSIKTMAQLTLIYCNNGHYK
jgi:hypothetical protein